MTLRSLITAGLAALTVLAVAVAAQAWWSGDGSSSGTAATGAVGAPTGVTASASGANVSVTWTAPGSGATPTGYAVTREPAAGGSATTVCAAASTTSCADNGVAPGTYVYKVRSLVSTSWTSSAAQSGDVTIAAVDGVAPTTTDDATDTWRNTNVTVTLTAGDNAGGSGVGTTYYTTDGSTPAIDAGGTPQGTTAVYDTATKIVLSAEGVHTIKYFSRDNAGNSETVRTASKQVRIDKTAPAPVFTFPAASGSYDSTSWAAGCAVGAGTCGTAADAGGSGLTKVQVSIRQGVGSYYDGTSFASATEHWLDAAGTSSWNYAIAATKLSTGSYTVGLRATDTAGNTTSPVVSRTFTYSAPVACLTTPVTTGADLDTYASEDDKTTDNHGSETSFVVRSQNNKHARALVRFPLPAMPAGCSTVSSATLTLTTTATGAATGRTLELQRAGAAWTETTQPLFTDATLFTGLGTAANASSGTAVAWTTNVAALLNTMYSTGVNNGFVIRDSANNASPGKEQIFVARNGTPSASRPALSITFGP